MSKEAISTAKSAVLRMALDNSGKIKKLIHSLGRFTYKGI